METEDFKTKITQLYTDRSLTFNHLGQQALALGDANTVPNELQSKNLKAFGCL
jgi:hypothetical protein